MKRMSYNALFGKSLIKECHTMKRMLYNAPLRNVSESFLVRLFVVSK